MSIMDVVKDGELTKQEAIVILNKINSFSAFLWPIREKLSEAGISTDWISDISELDWMLRDLWDFIHIEHQPLSNVNISSECEKELQNVLGDYGSVDVFSMVHFAEEYFDKLDDQYKREIAEAAYKFKLFNPYANDTDSENFYDLCSPYFPEDISLNG